MYWSEISLWYEVQHTEPQDHRKGSARDPYQIIPNENFRKYFGGTVLPELKRNASRSNCLQNGSFLAIQKIMEEYSHPKMLSKYIGTKYCDIFLNLYVYSIIYENKVRQHYPIYAYNHPLFTETMHPYSDTKSLWLLSFHYRRPKRWHPEQI